MGYQLKTKNGHALLTMASLLQKAIRRSDVKAAGYAVRELYDSYSNYTWKKLMTISAEDCFGIMTKEILALWEADEKVNKGKKSGDKNTIYVSKAVTLLLYARKNRDADYFACNLMRSDKVLNMNEYFSIEEFTELENGVPDYVYDCHTIEGKKRGKTKEDFFREEDAALKFRQLSFFDLEGIKTM